ncbi:MAG: site-2 protease family protein [Sphingomonas sp.]
MADAASDRHGPVVNQEEKAAFPYWQWLLYRLLAVAFWAAAFVIYLTAYRDEPHVLFAALSLLAGAFVCTLVHETGHAVAALVCGWRIIAFVVRPIAWQIPNRNLVVLPRGFQKQFGGWVATVPRQFDPREKAQWCAILAGGPAASLALALIAFFGSWLFSEEPDRAGIAFAGVALGLGLQSLRVCVFAILPSAVDGVASDGAQWRAARRTDSDYEANRALQWIGTMLHFNVRLRDLPEWLLAGAEKCPRSIDGSCTSNRRAADRPSTRFVACR